MKYKHKLFVLWIAEIVTIFCVACSSSGSDNSSSDTSTETITTSTETESIITTETDEDRLGNEIGLEYIGAVVGDKSRKWCLAFVDTSKNIDDYIDDYYRSMIPQDEWTTRTCIIINRHTNIAYTCNTSEASDGYIINIIQRKYVAGDENNAMQLIKEESAGEDIIVTINK